MKNDKDENYNLNIGLSTLGNDEQQDDINRASNSSGFKFFESEKETVDELLFLLDKFGVGDEFTVAKYGEGQTTKKHS